MNKETTNKIIEAIQYIADMDRETALGYSGVFEEICEDYHNYKSKEDYCKCIAPIIRTSENENGYCAGCGLDIEV